MSNLNTLVDNTRERMKQLACQEYDSLVLSVAKGEELTDDQGEHFVSVLAISERSHEQFADDVALIRDALPQLKREVEGNSEKAYMEQLAKLKAKYEDTKKAASDAHSSWIQKGWELQAYCQSHSALNRIYQRFPSLGTSQPRGKRRKS
jgi:hypothetical protein